MPPDSTYYYKPCDGESLQRLYLKKRDSGVAFKRVSQVRVSLRGDNGTWGNHPFHRLLGNTGTMENHATIIRETLFNELKRKGMNNEIIPRFVKDVNYSFQIDPSVSLSDVNDRLHFLGWEDVELDYHTLQLAIASLEGDRPSHLS